jgi:hypothetical protein
MISDHGTPPRLLMRTSANAVMLRPLSRRTPAQPSESLEVRVARGKTRR